MARRQLKQRRSDGYTLLELLVVMGIIVLLAALVTPQVVGYLGKAKSDTAATQIGNIETALDLYYLDNGQYPTTNEGLSLLWKPASGAQNWSGPYLKVKGDLLDPWGEPYKYVSPGTNAQYDLFTWGADKVQGGEGEDRDITNW